MTKSTPLDAGNGILLAGPRVIECAPRHTVQVVRWGEVFRMFVEDKPVRLPELVRPVGVAALILAVMRVKGCTHALVVDNGLPTVLDADELMQLVERD